MRLKKRRRNRIASKSRKYSKPIQNMEMFVLYLSLSFNDNLFVFSRLGFLSACIFLLFVFLLSHSNSASVMLDLPGLQHGTFKIPRKERRPSEGKLVFMNKLNYTNFGSVTFLFVATVLNVLNSETPLPF